MKGFAAICLVNPCRYRLPLPANDQYRFPGTGPWLLQTPGRCHVVNEQRHLEALLRQHPNANVVSLDKGNDGQTGIPTNQRGTLRP